MKPTRRITNFKFAKAALEDELPWLRVEDFKTLDLPRPLVLVNGCMDLFHSGHAKILFNARKHGKTVVVALDSDELVRKRKPGRPIQSWIERAAMLNYMPVDFCCEIGSDKEFVQLVNILKPDLRVRGAEYRDKPSRIPDVPTLLVHPNGMRTTKIIERIQNAK